ncbi:flagellin N-terminal helical domain-containing protein, partial [Helicobacter japonicus]
MAFQVNTNINALNAHAQSTFTQYNLKNSMEKLSSGLRINKAADDASGMTIADSLRSQASALGQAIRNTNDGMGIIQIADKAMDEQIKILDTIKTKAVQAAQDGQSTQSRSMIQMDIKRLIEGLDNIGNTTTYNGMALLSGAFSNKEFQVGAYSNQSIKASIGATTSDKIGQVRIETGALVTASGEVTVTFKNVDGVNDVTLESVKISSSAGTGLGVLAEVINKNSDKTGIRAQANAITTSDSSIASGSMANVMINGISIGDIIGIKKNDSDGRLVQAFNAATMHT